MTLFPNVPSYPNANPPVNTVIADRTEFWWNERKPDEPTLWDSKIELSEKFSSTRSPATRCRST